MYINKLLKSVAIAALICGTTVSIGAIKNNDVAVAAAPKIEVYAQLPRTSQVRVSPNGQRVAMVEPRENEKSVYVYDLKDPSKVIVLPTPEGALLKDIRWGSDKHVIIRAQFRRVNSRGRSGRFGTEYSRYISTNIETGEQVILLNDKIYDVDNRASRVGTKGKAGGSSQGGVITHNLPNDPQHVLMAWAEYAGKAYRRQYKVDLDTGREALQRSLPIETSSVIMSLDGESVQARSEYDRRGNEYRVYVGENETDPIFRVAVPDDSNPKYALISVLPDSGKILMIDTEKDGLNLFTLDPNSKVKLPYKLPVDVDIPDGYDYSQVNDPYTDELIGVSWTDDYGNIVYTAEPYRSWAQRTSKVFPGQKVYIISRTRNNSAVTLYVQGDGEPGSYFLFEPEEGRISPLGSEYPELEKKDIAKTVRLNYEAADGLEIPAYLTLPPGKTKADGPFPLVAMPHGGPIGPRDDADFDWWAQHLAAQGYAVFKPQFRGSGGFTYSFQEKGYGEFGGAMLTDTVDGINYLIDQGFVNKDKICVTGASYGGYQAYALPMIEPDMFKCSVSLNGVSDINAIMEYEIDRGGADGGPIRFWNRVIGDFYKDKDKIAEQSPANRVDEIKAEIVIIHGEDDMTVPYEQAKIMSKALDKADRNDDILVLKNDDHYLSLAESRRKLLKTSDKLFEKYLK